MGNLFNLEGKDTFINSIKLSLVNTQIYHFLHFHVSFQRFFIKFKQELIHLTPSLKKLYMFKITSKKHKYHYYICYISFLLMNQNPTHSLTMKQICYKIISQNIYKYQKITHKMKKKIKMDRQSLYI